MSSPTKSSPAKSSPSKVAPSSPEQVAVTLEQRFAAITEKMSQFDLAIDPTNESSLNRAASQLEGITKELEHFMSNYLVNSTADNASRMLTDVNELITETKTLHGHILKQSGLLKAAPTVKPSSAKVETASSESPLNRHEIAKLLLLVSRAYAAEQFTPEKRNLMKNEIIQRKGYLRKFIELDNVADAIKMIREM